MVSKRKARFKRGNRVEFLAGVLHPVAEQGTIVGRLKGVEGIWRVRLSRIATIHEDSLRPLTAREKGGKET